MTACMVRSLTLVDHTVYHVGGVQVEQPDMDSLQILCTTLWLKPTFHLPRSQQVCLALTANAQTALAYSGSVVCLKKCSVGRDCHRHTGYVVLVLTVCACWWRSRNRCDAASRKEDKMLPSRQHTTVCQLHWRHSGQSEREQHLSCMNWAVA